MVLNIARKSVVVLSDNEALAKAIAFDLESSLGVEVVRIAPDSSSRRRKGAEVGDFDLMVVAMSSPTSEPVVALAMASLAERIGRVPLLIISDRPFRPAPDSKIFHLDFPFDLDRLDEKAQEILDDHSAIS